LRSLRVARPRFNVLLLIHLTPLRRNSSAYGVSQSTVRRGNASLGDDGYDRALKKRAAAAGLDAALFSWHSCRARFLTSAAEAGADIIKMSEVSRHKSMDVLRRYVRRGNLFKSHAGSAFL